MIPDNLNDCDLWSYTLLHLPTIREAVLAIVAYSPKYGSAKQKKVLHRFCDLLRLKWIQAFGDCVIGLKYVKSRLNEQLKIYSSKVTKQHGSKRQKLLNWSRNKNTVFSLFSAKFKPEEEFANDLEALNYYNDQFSLCRLMAISRTETDKNYEQNLAMQRELNQQIQAEVNFPYQISSSDQSESEQSTSEPLETSTNDEPECSNADVSLTRSGRVLNVSIANDKKSFADQSTQADLKATPDIRITRNFHDNIKCALAAASTKANISAGQARICFQTTSEIFHDQVYYLSAEEISNDIDTSQPKRPRTKEDWKKYANVIPSKQVINKTKYLLAIQHEKNIALALIDPSLGDVSCLQYDATS